ncbi:MAG: phosphoribosyl-ATP diphosphatase [Methylobacteriaceae bacterium]|nr:phosphoribosyl-ATP diphosphatase [Methylobacteriaceae bacterium]
MNRFSLDDLAAIIIARAGSTAEQSYTKSLLEAGPARAAKKLGEEAVETVIAAIEGDRTALIKESADVLYHLLVLLTSRGISFDEVMAELKDRTSRSGHTEKAARGD